MCQGSDIMNNQNDFSNSNSRRASSAYFTVLQFLMLTHIPRRLNGWQTAALVGCEPHHIPILVKGNLLKPLGNPPPNAQKYFSRDYVLALASDDVWLKRMSDLIVKHWANRNAAKKNI